MVDFSLISPMKQIFVLGFFVCILAACNNKHNVSAEGNTIEKEATHNKMDAIVINDNYCNHINFIYM